MRDSLHFIDLAYCYIQSVLCSVANYRQYVIFSLCFCQTVPTCYDVTQMCFWFDPTDSYSISVTPPGHNGSSKTNIGNSLYSVNLCVCLDILQSVRILFFNPQRSRSGRTYSKVDSCVHYFSVGVYNNIKVVDYNKII